MIKTARDAVFLGIGLGVGTILHAELGFVRAAIVALTVMAAILCVPEKWWRWR